jgi:ADP-heptose:LPS heptosyltransferase
MGTHAEVLGRRVREACRFPHRVQFLQDLDIARLAGVISESTMLISNDTGPMHLGPALGIPTMGLFSVGLPEHFRPTGPHDVFLQADPIDGISTEDVIHRLEMMRYS